MTKLEAVFGVSASQVLSYIERTDVDDKFRDALSTDKQIIVYGASKQGKTALVSKYLPYKENLQISVTPKTEIRDIYASVLRQSGIIIESKHTKQNGRETSTSGALSFTARIPFFGDGKISTKAEGKSSDGYMSEFIEIPFNLELPQDISELLGKIKSTRWIIIENFHYLNDERQRQLAFDLRTFQELGVRFIILGVWREKNRLAQFNGDLLDRTIEVPVEPWTTEEFQKVAEKGSAALAVRFSQSVLNKLIEASFGSIGVFQELLKEYCTLSKVRTKSAVTIELNDEQMIQQATNNKVQEYATRHRNALESIASGNLSIKEKAGRIPLFLPYYLTIVLLTTGKDGLKNGMRRAALQDEIQKIHHRGSDVRPSDMSNLLHKIGELQSKKAISPPIIDYDQHRKTLQVVDSTFHFFLKHADLESIASEIPNPIE